MSIEIIGIQGGKGGGGGGSTIVKQAQVTLNNNQIKALQSTPQTIISAGGANVIQIPFFAYFKLLWFADYTGIDPSAIVSIKPLLSAEFFSNFSNGSTPDPRGQAVSEIFAPGGNTDAVISGSVGNEVVGMGFPNIVNLVMTGSYWNGAGNTITPNVPFVITMFNGGADMTGGDARNQLFISVNYTTITIPF